MKKVFYLKTCSTCRRIMGLLNLEGWQLRELKSENISPEELEALYALAGSYEALFNRRSTQYKELGLKDKALSEQDYRAYILNHYSFLKRPVFWDDSNVFIGNAKATVEELINHINKS